jgi:hypothetical protein
MGALQDRIDLNQKVFGKNIIDFYKNNVIYMVDKYSKSDDMCTAISVTDISPGRFYFFHYEDPSNWIKYSPVFVVDYKQIRDMFIILAVNFNFIPLEIRSGIFDKFILEKNFIDDDALEVDFQGVYRELVRFGFEYSILEYNAIQLKLVHQINLELLARFLYSSHPKNTYDPNKLMEIWTKKIETRKERHEEMMTSVLSEFYEVDGIISQKYEALESHIKRLQNSLNRFKNK